MLQVATVEGSRQRGGESDYEGRQDEWEEDVLNSSAPRRRCQQQSGEKEERGGGR